MGKWKKRLLYAFLFVGVLVVAVGYGFYWMMTQSLYKIGNVRNQIDLRASLDPPAQPSDNDPGEEFWQVENDVRLSYQSFGEGRPALIVHGGPGIPYQDHWKGLESLNKEFEFFYYHQRGCGNSSRPIDKFKDESFYQNLLKLDKTLGLGAQIADIERIRRILGEEKLILIGHSYGGFLATLYAAEFPERVEKLVLIAPAGVLTAMDEERDLFKAAKKKLPTSMHEEYEKVKSKYLDFGNVFSLSDQQLADRHSAMGNYLLQAMGYNPDDFKSDIRPGGWAVFAMFFSAGMAPDYSPALSMINCPTLIIHGKDDLLSRAGSETYRPISGSKFSVVSSEKEGRRAGHFPFDDCPEEFSKVITKFLSVKKE